MNAQSKLEATVEGYLTGFEFDNKAEVIEKSLVIEILKDIQSQLIEIKRKTSIKSGKSFPVKVGERFGFTSSQIPHSTDLYPIWFDDGDICFVNKILVEFIKG